MITAHVFIATSLDGFIARADGRIDWLVCRDDPAEDHGYTEFIADKDVIVMGRGCYETVASFTPWPYDLPVIVLSEQLAGSAVPGHLAGRLRFSRLRPRQLLEELALQNLRRVYVDGGQVIQSFLREGLIDEMVITTVPVLIGSGKPLFGAVGREVDLELVASRSFPSGLVQSSYRVVR